MKKISTKNTYYEQINLSLAYINSNYHLDIKVEELASISGYSLYHFHRIFKDITGESVYDYIKNTRLEKASNLLIYNQHKKIQTFAHDCGFATATGFSAAFKKRFGVTPKEWRKVGYELYSSNITNIKFDIEEPIIVNEPIKYILYMRTYGYKADMSDIWRKLYNWCELKDVFDYPHNFLGLFHNHPSYIPYENARYLACIESSSEVYRSGEVGRCRIIDGKFAKFSTKCTHEELYKIMQQIYINWLPNSGYELRNFPTFVKYKTPLNLLDNSLLDVDIFIPLQLSK